MNVFEPTLEMICIEDIAHALSNQCRFGGHLPEFYSVAQHSLLCSQTVGDEYKLQALLHDASEAYLLDIPRPIKQGLSNYKELEDKLMILIADKFGFKYPLEKPVKQIDEQMLQFEWDHLMLKKPLIDNFVCWSAGYAKRRFLETYDELSRVVMNSKNTDKIEQILRNITKAQDDDGHWYWIPNRLLAEFRNELNEISGKDYMDCPDEFDSFMDKYDKYRTLGDPNNIPDFFDKQNG